MASKKPRGFLGFFKKAKKTSKVQNLGILGFFYLWVKFYFKFHILIVICVLCYILQKCSERE